MLITCALQLVWADTTPQSNVTVHYTGQTPLPTRWISKDGSLKPTHEVPADSDPQAIMVPAIDTAIQPQIMAMTPGVKGRIAIVIHSSIYSSVIDAVNDFSLDLQASGYSTIIRSFTQNAPAQSLRTDLRTLYNQPDGLKGAILIGNIPYIIYELMQDWGSGVLEYEDFPCDLYYEDLDGVWSDSLTNGSVMPNNGKYDTRSGNLNLEIWVGRIRTSGMVSLGSETSLINNYLSRNHAYRTQTQTTTVKAIAYDDDDWSGMAADDVYALKKVFGTNAVTGYNDPNGTTVADYKSKLPVSTRWYLIRSHGWPGGHGFYENDKSVFNYIYESDYRNIDPPGAFYSLFVCSGCDFTATDYLGGTVVFNPQSRGLLSVGSTKTGGMWSDYDFYYPMSQGECIGESFRRWFNAVQYWDVAPPWWYGMVMTGDPSLHPNPSTWPKYHPLYIYAAPNNGGTVKPAVGTYNYPEGVSIPITATPAAGYMFTNWHGVPVADPQSPNTTITLSAASYLVAVFTPIPMSQFKAMDDNASVTLVDKIVTYADTNYFYIEDENRSSGIKVSKNAHGLLAGMKATTIIGTLKTDTLTSERYILATTAIGSGSGNSVRPLGLNNRFLGGADWNYNSGTGAGQKGVVDGVGTNNIGLLVTVWGRVKSVDADSRTFIIADGSRAKRSGFEDPQPILIKVTVPAGVDLPDKDAYVSLKGISSCYKDDVTGEVLPMVRMVGSAIPRT
jgi:hypothetical protein